MKVFVKLYGAVVARMRAHNLLNIEVYYVDSIKSIESIDGRESPLYIHVNNILISKHTSESVTHTQVQ